ncbi:alpha/beta fold hydrolase [Dactylosporangium sp. CA-233914]|uniref:alpha/beta fold hydrolase n=1 Tax=Dactylosporangium sp. CA-233914 TaxID=3239934 RepID=UPI003D8A1479
MRKFLFPALGLLLALPVAAAAFVAGALVSDVPPVLSLLALVGAALVALLGARLGRLGPRPGGAVVAVALLLTVSAGLYTFGPSLGSLPAAEPSQFWELPTGSRLAYTAVKAQGPRRDTPVVLLHGGPGTPGDGPGDLGAALAAEGFDVYAYDQLGGGASTRLADPTGYTVDRQLADLEAVRQRLGAERVVLVGGSWGATLAAEYLAAHPEHVAAAVFVSPGAIWTPQWRDSGEGDIWDRLTPAQQAQVDELEASPKLAAWSVLMGVNPRAAHALVPDAELDAVFDRLLSVAAPAATCHPDRPVTAPSARPGFYVNQLTSADQDTRPDPRPALRRVSVPALVLRGQCDYKRWEIAREYRETIPGARMLWIPDAGHVIEFEQPRVYREAIVGFLTGRPLPLPDYTGTEAPA